MKRLCCNAARASMALSAAYGVSAFLLCLSALPSALAAGPIELKSWNGSEPLILALFWPREWVAFAASPLWLLLFWRLLSVVKDPVALTSACLLCFLAGNAFVALWMVMVHHAVALGIPFSPAKWTHANLWINLGYLGALVGGCILMFTRNDPDKALT